MLDAGIVYCSVCVGDIYEATPSYRQFATCTAGLTSKGETDRGEERVHAIIEIAFGFGPRRNRIQEPLLLRQEVRKFAKRWFGSVNLRERRSDIDIG
jgi:hypothetical protein